MGFVKCSLVALALLALQHQTLPQVLAASGNGGLFGSGNESEGDLSAGDNSYPSAEANGYLPPLGSSPSDQVPAFSGPPKGPGDNSGRDDSPTNVQPNVAFPAVQPQVGCAAALLCVEEQFCTTAGVISKTPLQLTDAQKLRRVPMVDCRNPESGIVGKCCRDPDYVDPWPAGNLSPEQLKQGFDEQGFPKFLNLSKNKPPRPVRPVPVPNQSVQFNQVVRPQQPQIFPAAQPAVPFQPIQPAQTGFQQNKIVPETKPFRPQQPTFGQAQLPAFVRPIQSKNPFLPQQPKPFQPLQSFQPQTFQPEQPAPQAEVPEFVAEFPQQAKQPEIVLVPEQPQSFLPQQPTVFQQPKQPQQPHGFIAAVPEQPEQPEQPTFFQPEQPEQPQQPAFFQPEQPQQPGFFQPEQPSQPAFFQPAQPQQPVKATPPVFSQTKQPEKAGPFNNFNFPNLQGIPQAISNQFSNLNPFKPQKPADTETINAPADVPDVPLAIATTTTKKPFFSNFPNLPSFGFGQKVVDSQPEAPIGYPTIAAHTPGAQCGIINQVQQSYAGGLNDVETPFGEIPWQAMVLHNANKKLLCSGAVISPNVVMTAAHCVYGMSPSEVSIKVGEWKLGYELKHEEPLPFEIAQVQNIETHPGYQPGGPGSDLAMLFLEKPVKLDQHIDTICLSQQPSALQRKCISVGWGKTVLQLHAAGALMNKIEVDTLNQDQCRTRLQGAESGLDLDDSLVCVKAHKQNNNLCQVDVGGPLACDRGDGHYELVGVYSQDTGCLPTNQVATFALIDNKWVNDMLNTPSFAAAQQTPEALAPGNFEGPQPGQDAPSRIHYHPQQPGVPCDCQQGTQPAGSNAYLPPY